MGRTWKSTVAGILNFIAVPYFILSLIMVGDLVRVLVWQLWEYQLPLILERIMRPLQFFAESVGMLSYVHVTIFYIIVAWSLVLLTFAVVIAGGIFALRRKLWGLALAGSIGSLLCAPLLGIPATIFIALSKKDFK